MSKQSLTINGITKHNEYCPRLVAENIGHACTGLHSAGTIYDLDRCNDIKKVCLTCPLKDKCIYELKGQAKMEATELLMENL